MAKLSLVNREAKRVATVKKFAAKRAELKAAIVDQTRSMEDRMDAMKQLQALAAQASPVRLRNRCEMTGRAARDVPQVWTGARQDPRSGNARRHSRPGQSQLVGEEIDDEYE